jgi:probable HAF family extracellular repeat protein
VILYDTHTQQSFDAVSVGDPSRNIATAISDTKHVTGLHGHPTQAAVWSEAKDWVDLGSPHAAGCGDDDISGAFDISDDGSVIVGLAWNGCQPDAFRFSGNQFTTLQVLGTSFNPPNPPSNRASVVSADGRVSAGFAELAPLDRSAAVWGADGTGILIDPTNVDAPSEILSINGDGTVVAGITGFDAYVWSASTGMVPIPRTDTTLPSDPIFPNAMSFDGTTVYGGIGSAFFSIPVAFVWTAADGTRALADVATAAGITLPKGLILNNVLGASSDGKVLIGVAMDAEFNPKTFVLRLP